MPECFDVIDFAKQQLIEIVARYTIKRRHDAVQVKYAQLLTKRSRTCAWKHQKEQEPLSQMRIQNAWSAWVWATRPRVAPPSATDGVT